jgi:NADH-quinone oxidoreductase subunit L
MLLLVSIISSMVHLYSLNYMENDFFKLKFIGIISLFTFFMLVLILSGNFIQLFLG